MVSSIWGRPIWSHKYGEGQYGSINMGDTIVPIILGNNNIMPAILKKGKMVAAILGNMFPAIMMVG